MNNLKQYEWAIDYSQSTGQKHATIRPEMFKTKEEAESFNMEHSPKGKITKVVVVIMNN